MEKCQQIEKIPGVLGLALPQSWKHAPGDQCLKFGDARASACNSNTEVKIESARWVYRYPVCVSLWRECLLELKCSATGKPGKFFSILQR